MNKRKIEKYLLLLFVPRPGVEPGIFRFSFNLSLIAVPLTNRQPRSLLCYFDSLLVNIILNSLLIDFNSDLYSSVVATVSMSQDVTKKVLESSRFPFYFG